MKIYKFDIDTKLFVLVVVLSLSFLISFLTWKVGVPGKKAVFVFESADMKSLSIEKRFLKCGKADSKVRNFVEELLLGPISEHCIPVFNSGTKVISCFERNNVLYVNLSSDFLYADYGTDFSKKINIFKKNIQINFPSIRRVELFVDGNAPFQY